MPDLRTTIPGALLALFLFISAHAAGDEASASDGLPIMFLPPPMEGTISLGVFDRAGKLVRVLHREAAQSDFKIGENGLITRWNGRDDAGQPLPPGKYRAAGWMAGDLGVEGVAFHGNDWIKDESPRYARVTGVKNSGRDEVRVALRTADGKEETLGWKLNREGVDPPKIEIEAGIEDGGLVIRKGGESHLVTLSDGEKPLAAVVGHGDCVWAIVGSPEGSEVRGYSAQGDFLRRLAYQKGEPQPRQIAASQWGEMIFLLEENATEQRLRALALGPPEQPVPKPAGDGPQPASATAWRVTYFRRVLTSESFDAIAGHLGRAKPLKAVPVAKIQARLNPLLGDQKPDVLVKVALDAEGAVLKTKDDLPLAHLTNTPNLKWVALVEERGALLLFQGDGAVVEEFKISRPDNLMSFDAGEYELKAPGAKPPPPKRGKPLRPGDDL